MVRCSLKVVLMGFVLCMTAVSAMATPLKGFVVFGDSLSDNGNLYEYMKHQLPISPPYYHGRFTNGPVWIEHLAASYYPTDASAHMSNYAFGGSGVAEPDEDEDEYLLNDGAMLTLDSQVNSYLLAHDDKANDSSLYVIWTGSNNYLALPDDINMEVRFVVAGIRRNAEHLLEKGAKHIMLLGLPDLGRIPMAFEFEATDELSQLANTHNAILEAEVQKLQVEHPNVEWIFFPVNNMFHEALDYPERYGFTNTTDTCYETLASVPSSQSILSMAARIKPRPLRNSICDEYLFFDPVHPSARGHEYIGQEARKLLDDLGMQFE
jgi:phospholipase/lecithinase/hemolysin